MGHSRFVLPGNLMEYQIRQLRGLGVPFRPGTALRTGVAVEQLSGLRRAVFVATGAGACPPAAEGLDLPGGPGQRIVDGIQPVSRENSLGIRRREYRH